MVVPLGSLGLLAVDPLAPTVVLAPGALPVSFALPVPVAVPLGTSLVVQAAALTAIGPGNAGTLSAPRAVTVLAP